MSSAAVRGWSWVHKWSSLVSTAFMLLLCITGLPLLFHHEIGHLLGTEAEPPAMAADAPRARIDDILTKALAQHPGTVVQFYGPDEDDDRMAFVTLNTTADASTGFTSLMMDARTAEPLPHPPFDQGFMYIMFRLHVDLFADLPGKLFLGFMGFLLLVAIVSGVVLYAPFMRKLDFGSVRRDRKPRTKWLDLHNLLGVTTLVWAFVVGATGMINTWADLVFKFWQNDQMAQMVAPYKGLPPPAHRVPVQLAADAAQALLPGMQMRFIAFPGSNFSSPHHYAVFMKGDTPLTARLLQPVLVDAETGQVTDSRPLPWYGKALLISQPLHFGDYGGTPLQLLWALLDIATIVVLGSGLYLWIKKR
ncbi:PepSY domain-containing protein [Xylophilus rhododendri]|uniref:PepSY domain-containing protein n=1 Tax=Xylophilus rhododendri TaxID=2697032 RepID=A0A857JFW4_9BURK|nr:PepSY domain-containing protein [Xylophilus rhododendri]QHJ01556.1 PepSY domain-containing protein [Xylophilus rhododendri]